LDHDIREGIEDILPAATDLPVTNILSQTAKQAREWPENAHISINMTK
jgi:hypothetical protein